MFAKLSGLYARATLSTKLALVLCLALGIISASMYFVLIPVIEKEYIRLEQRRLADLVDGMYSIIRNYHHQARQGLISMEEAQEMAKRDVRSARYGEADYFWINDLTAPYPVMLMHPIFPELEGKIFENEQYNTVAYMQEGLNGRLEPYPGGRGNVLKILLEACRATGSGYIIYMWPNPAEGGDSRVFVPKLSYGRIFPQWGWLIGTGVYIDRKDVTVAALRRWGGTLLGSTFLLTLVLTIWLTRIMVGRQAEALATYADRVAKGDLDAPCRDMGFQGELLTLHDSLLSMVAKVREQNLAIAAALDRSEDRFRLAIENSPYPVMMYDASGNILTLNQTWTQMTGYTLKDVPTIASMAARCNVDDPLELLDPLLLADGADHAELNGVRIQSAGGATRLWDMRIARLGSVPEIGDIFICKATDQTERHKAEEVLKENEALLNKILRGIRAGIIVLDADTLRTVEANEVAAEIIDIPKDELIGMSCNDMGWKRPQRGADDNFCLLTEESAANLEYNLERRDGTLIPVYRTTLTAVKEGRPLLYDIFFDISHQKSLEAQLSLAQRLESIGCMASGIAHEINTPIQYIGDNLTFLQSAFSGLVDELQKRRDAAPNDDTTAEEDLDFFIEEAPKALAQSREGVDKVAAIVQAMRRLSHSKDDAKAAYDLTKAIENTLTISRNEWKYQAEVETDLSDEARFVTCYGGQINQVLLNIIVNASHAIVDKYKGSTDKGKISIRTRLDGNFAEITVSDTGCGIPPENLQRIFNPFFTTKEVGKGTGQGLAIVHDIVVNRHGGSIAVDSTVGQGTTFTVRIPIE